MMRDYRTDWSIPDRANMDMQVYSILMRAMENTSAFRNKELFFQYADLLYIAGKRRIEPFLRPVTVMKLDYNGHHYYKITSIVAKHYRDRSRKKCVSCGMVIKGKEMRKQHKLSTGHVSYVVESDREVKSHIWRAESIHEKALFDYLLHGRSAATLDFRPLLPSRYQDVDIDSLVKEYNEKNGNLFIGITSRFDTMLKARVASRKGEVDSSLVPHMLRHMRAYDLLVNHQYAPVRVQNLLDWYGQELVFYYSDIREMLHEQEEFVWYEQNPAREIMVKQ